MWMKFILNDCPDILKVICCKNCFVDLRFWFYSYDTIRAFTTIILLSKNQCGFFKNQIMLNGVFLHVFKMIFPNKYHRKHDGNEEQSMVFHGFCGLKIALIYLLLLCKK